MADLIVDWFDRRSGICIDPDRFDTGVGASPMDHAFTYLRTGRRERVRSVERALGDFPAETGL